MKILETMSARKWVGEAAHVCDVTEELRQRGHTVELVLRRDTAVTREATRRGILHHAMHMGSRFHPIHDVQDVLALRRLIRDFQPDVIHAHRGKDHWLVAAALWGLACRPPLFRSRHVVTPIHAHILNRWLLARATTRMICSSEAVLASVRASARFVVAPIVVPGGIMAERYPPVDANQARAFRESLGIAQDVPMLVCLARLAAVKGQEGILRAFVNVRARFPDAVLVMAYQRGEEFRQALECLAAELNLTPSVRWVSALEAIGPLLTAADISLIGSLGSEGWSRVAVESGFYGVPVVSTPVGSVPEIVQDGVTGYIAASMAPDDMAEAICTILAMPDRGKCLGAAGRARVLSHYTLAKTTDMLLQLFSQPEMVGPFEE